MSSFTCGCVYSDDGMGTPLLYCTAHQPTFTTTPPAPTVHYIAVQCPHCVRLEAEVTQLRALIERCEDLIEWAVREDLLNRREVNLLADLRAALGRV
jgi:hypothetical protein